MGLETGPSLTKPSDETTAHISILIEALWDAEDPVKLWLDFWSIETMR